MKNTLLFLVFIFLSFSCSNDKTIGVDYDFINPEINNPTIENQIIGHITNRIQYEPISESSSNKLIEEHIRLISKEIFDFIDVKELDSINKSNNEDEVTNYFIERIHQFILSKENELVSGTEPYLSIENFRGKGEKNIEGTLFKPKFKINELSSYYDPKTSELIKPREIEENGWSFSKLVLRGLKSLNIFHGKLKYHYLGIDKIAHEGNYFIGIPYDQQNYYSPSGELIHSENRKLTIWSVTENGIQIGSVLHGDYMSKTNGLNLGGYMKPNLEFKYGKDLGRPNVIHLDNRKIYRKSRFDYDNVYKLGRKDKFICKYFNNHIHGETKTYEELYTEKWDDFRTRTYEEDSIPTIHNFIHGRLDGHHKSYKIVSVKLNKRGYKKLKKVYSGYRTYKMGVLEGPYLSFSWKNNNKPHETIESLSKGNKKGTIRIGENIDISGENIYDIKTSSIIEKNIKKYTLNNFEEFKEYDLEREFENVITSHGKSIKYIKDVEVNVAFDLLLNYGEELGFNPNRADYSRNNNIDLNPNNNNITIRPNSMYRLGYIKNRILYQIKGDIVVEGEYYKGLKINEWRKYIVLKDTPKSYTNVDFPYIKGDTIFLLNGTYHKEKKYLHLDYSKAIVTRLKDYSFINNNITSQLLPKYGSVSSDRYIISSFDNFINEYETDVNQQSINYTNRTIRFFPNNKIIYREKGIKNYEIYNLKGELVSKCCN